jgi:hypothetical protein
VIAIALVVVTYSATNDSLDDSNISCLFVETILGLDDRNEFGSDDGNELGSDDGNELGSDDGNELGSDDGNELGSDGGNELLLNIESSLVSIESILLVKAVIASMI